LPAPYELGGAVLYAGDCRNILSKLGPVDAIVTDPPYHLVDIHARARRSFAGNRDGSLARLSAGFMGQTWDGGDIAFRAETWAALAAVIKPGGYLLAFGGTRTHHRIWSAIEDAGFVIQDTIAWLYGQGFPKGRTQLKPAYEPIVVAYKPGAPRALSIDECRIAITPDDPNHRPGETEIRVASASIFGNANRRRGSLGEGRWPANLAHDGSDEVMEAFAAFGSAPGALGVKREAKYRPGLAPKDFRMQRPCEPRGDTGTAARFFYCAKAGKADRAGSKHPTIKPISLLRWLVRLVTPPGGTVLDPFAGSGTTGAAALAEGRRAILIEREAEYIADIRRRLSGGKATAAA
jgi:site-specific DNA-methyltransferase (adenine-specific)